MEWVVYPVGFRNYASFEMNPKADYTLRFVMAGDRGVGKTAMLRAYSGIPHFGENPFGKHSLHKTISLRGKSVDIQVVDTAGREAYATLTHSYLRQADGCVICFNVCTSTSFDHMETVWFPDLSALDGPKLLVGTCRHNQEGGRRVVSVNDATTLAARYNVEYVEVNMNNTADIDALFHKLAGLAIDALEESSKVDNTTVKLLPTRKKHGSKNCCH